MRKLLFLAAMPFMLAGAPAQAQLSGSLGIAEQTCVLPIATFVFQNCGYSGGANISADLTGGNVWIGPLGSGGFYTSIAAAPGFTLSTQTGLADDGTPLTSFLVGVGTSPGDGKVAPSVTGNISVAASVVSGSFTIGAGARSSSGGGNLAGSKQAVESWTSITHVLTAKLADSVVGGNAFGGSDYIIGSDGFPTLLCAGTGGGGVGGCFGGESEAISGAPPTVGSPWIAANGGNGPFATTFGAGDPTDIVSYTNAFPIGSPANFGTVTSATMSGVSCVDSGLDPKEPGSPVDTVTDCTDSSVVWSSTIADAVDGLARTNASFDNLIMKVSTDGGGSVVAVDAYYVLQYSIISPGYNSWVGGRIQMEIIPVPAAVWLFGSALGLLGWIRRRVTA